MEWKEVNCIIDALKLLIEQLEATLHDQDADEDTRADATNDLAYTEILLHKYEDVRNKIAAS